MDTPTPDVSELSFDQLMELERRAAAAQPDAPTDESPLEYGTGSEPIVLPWWQRPFNIAVLVVTAALVAGMIGWMVGDAGAAPAHNDVDTGFLQDMRTHHEQAVDISLIYRSRNDIDPGLQAVARSIIRGQSLEVGRMIQLLRSFGEEEANQSDTSMLWMGMIGGQASMPGIASEAELDRLARVDGAEADRLFVELMSRHHLGGIEMADYVATHGENDEVVLMATSMAEAQRGEINEMIDLLRTP